MDQRVVRRKIAGWSTILMLLPGACMSWSFRILPATSRSNTESVIRNTREPIGAVAHEEHNLPVAIPEDYGDLLEQQQNLKFPSLVNDTRAKSQTNLTLVGMSDVAESKDIPPASTPDAIGDAITKITGLLQQQDDSVAKAASQKAAADSKYQNSKKDDKSSAKRYNFFGYDIGGSLIGGMDSAPLSDINGTDVKDLDQSILGFDKIQDVIDRLEVLSSTSLVIPSIPAPTNDQKQKGSDQEKLGKEKDSNHSKRERLKNWANNILTPQGADKKKEASRGDSRSDVSGGQIDPDIQEVADAIAVNIYTIEQWRLFCEKGGWKDSRITSLADYKNTYSAADVSAAFGATCYACRALRDLCAMSPELSAVITEDILDASSSNDDSPGGVVASLVSLLQYAMAESKKNSK